MAIAVSATRTRDRATVDGEEFAATVANGAALAVRDTTSVVLSPGSSWSVSSGAGTTQGARYTAPATGLGTATLTNGAGVTITIGHGPTVVAAENQLAGTARATWDLPTAGNVLAGVSTLQGFADGFTFDKDETVQFKVAQSDAAGWTGEVFRLGWYGGNGARSYGAPTTTDVAASQAQPAPGDADSVTTKLSTDCSNWSVTATWTPPAWAPSGIYVLRLNRTGGGASHILFILRDDARTADLMLMPADSTWQAYNAFGGMGASLYNGNSLYYGTPVDQYNADAARFVSYNRPIINRGAVHGGYGAVQWSTFFTGEYPMVRFLERNGADVKYYGCIDAMGDPTGARLAGKVSAVMMVGHNEYWSDGMRSGWEVARAAGVSLFTCAGNEVFWRTVGDQADSVGRPRRIECYKSTIAARSSTGRAQWTGTWRDPDGAGKGGNAPENTLTGTIFVVNGPDLRALVVPFTGGYSARPIWRNTAAGAISSGSWTSPSQILGFEWDTYGPAGTNGAGAAYLAAPHASAVYCSDATYAIGSGLLLVDAGDEYGGGNATHRLVAYPGEQGQLCFGTGTINWALGVDNANTYQSVGNDNTSSVLQQATLNVLADMGVEFGSLMAGMTQPTPTSWW
jgi:hypothetical protein